MKENLSKVRCLHEISRPSGKLAKLFLRAKFGDRKAILKCAAQMTPYCAQIIGKQKQNKAIAFCSSFYPINTAFLTSKIISEELGVPQAILKHAKPPHAINYHELSARGKIKATRKLVSCGTNVSGKEVVLIDDCFASGSAFTVSSMALKKGGAKKVHCLAFAKLVRPVKEQMLLREGIKNEGIEFICGMLKKGEATSTLLRTITRLDSPGFKEMTFGLSEKRRHLLLEELKEFCDCNSLDLAFVG